MFNNNMSSRDVALMTAISFVMVVPFLCYARSIDKSLRMIAEGMCEEEYEEYEEDVEGE